MRLHRRNQLPYVTVSLLLSIAIGVLLMLAIGSRGTRTVTGILQDLTPDKRGVCLSLDDEPADAPQLCAVLVTDDEASIPPVGTRVEADILQIPLHGAGSQADAVVLRRPE